MGFQKKLLTFFESNKLHFDFSRFWAIEFLKKRKLVKNAVFWEDSESFWPEIFFGARYPSPLYKLAYVIFLMFWLNFDWSACSGSSSGGKYRSEINYLTDAAASSLPLDEWVQLVHAISIEAFNSFRAKAGAILLTAKMEFCKKFRLSISFRVSVCKETAKILYIFKLFEKPSTFVCNWQIFNYKTLTINNHKSLSKILKLWKQKIFS